MRTRGRGSAENHRRVTFPGAVSENGAGGGCPMVLRVAQVGMLIALVLAPVQFGFGGGTVDAGLVGRDTVVNDQ